MNKKQILNRLDYVYDDLSKRMIANAIIDYKKYYDLLKDDFVSLAYLFLKEIKNNYQLYDIEIYPRVYPYLEKEKTTIENVTFKKIRCDEEKISFYIFNINENIHIESNYDDTIVTYKEKNVYEVKYENQIDLLDISNNTYIMNDVVYECKELY